MVWVSMGSYECKKKGENEGKNSTETEHGQQQLQPWPFLSLPPISICANTARLGPILMLFSYVFMLQ